MRHKVPEWLNIDVENFRQHYENLARQLREMEDFARNFNIPLGKGVGKGGALPPGERFTHMTLRNAAATVLEEAGTPLHLSHIYDALLSGGATIGGKDPKNTLYGTIQGYEQFVKVGKNVWDLADRHRAGPNEVGRSY